MVKTVTAVQIANPPLAILEEHVGVDATGVLVLDTDFAVFGPADPKWV